MQRATYCVVMQEANAAAKERKLYGLFLYSFVCVLMVVLPLFLCTALHNRLSFLHRFFAFGYAVVCASGKWVKSRQTALLRGAAMCRWREEARALSFLHQMRDCFV